MGKKKHKHEKENEDDSPVEGAGNSVSLGRKATPSQLASSARAQRRNTDTSLHGYAEHGSRTIHGDNSDPKEAVTESRRKRPEERQVQFERI